ncbi:hypothetical protein [Flectobacillus sp. BAB-3569]|jgi:hypothetical protein|uniref:hypothetical protein n=1 Tax=unclassified Flectobacillus TaxID=2621086 RepID=UPI000BA31C53|nr:hypothetical protein [Flectobacillus sp. BAB-3569]NBA74283.1 hypothetical protein [Emticicia sp. ODNR4P]PAC30657.1 hypothetical protein BWI92_11550 [Flectobacillus sp. BAB-3569]
MNTFVTETEDLVDYLAGIERAKRPKKAKSLKNYIATFFVDMQPPQNPHNLLRDLEQKGWIFIGLNGDIIYNF